MSAIKPQTANAIRADFTAAMSQMYRKEVPLYASLYDLVANLNQTEITASPELYAGINTELLSCEYHGAIRLGSAKELAIMRRLFAVMGMFPVDYYDLSVAGIPVHSTAFRPIELVDLQENPFRMFTSLLRLDLVDDALRQTAASLLATRYIFSETLIALIETAEKEGGLETKQAAQFIAEVLEIFRWHSQAQVDFQTYELLNNTHRLIADVVSFKGPHINHLTPRSLNIDALQSQLSQQGFQAKAVVEGPPKRDCPILLRQTSFIAQEELVMFVDGEQGTHTARFGEVEQRGIALTPKGRALYDALLHQARNNKSDPLYHDKLKAAFVAFPDDHRSLYEQGLAYYRYTATSKPCSDVRDVSALLAEGSLQITPIVYEDFLPVSAAGIFTSNLLVDADKKQQIQQSPNQASFETALGAEVIDSFSLYQKIQDDSLQIALDDLAGVR